MVNYNPLGARNPQLDDPRKIASIVPYRVKLDNTYIPAAELIYHADAFDVKYVGGGVRYHYYLEGPTNPNAAPVSQYTQPGAFGNLIVFPSYSFYYQEILEWQSHELNIVSSHKGPLQYVLGAYYFGEHYDQPVSSGLPQQPQLASPIAATCFEPNFTGCPVNPDRRIYDDRPSLNINSKAAFAQVDWEFLPTFKTTLGVRYTKDDYSGFESGRLLLFGSQVAGITPQQLGPFTPALDLTQLPTAISRTAGKGVVGTFTFDPASGFGTRRYASSFDAVTGTAGLQWEPERGTLAFAKYSRGYKAGGYRLGIDAILGPTPLTEPESVNAYELGFKKAWLNRTLITDVSLFYYDYQNAQIPISVGATSATGAPNAILFNVPKSVSEGFELETQWNPIRNLSLIFNYSFLDAHVTKGQQVDPTDPQALAPGARPLLTNAQCLARVGAANACPADPYTADPATGNSTATGGFQLPQNLNGNKLPNSAEHKVAFNANYTLKTSIGDFIASGSYTWRSEQYGSVFDRSYYLAPAVGQFDARLTFHDKRDRFTVIAYGRNLTDELIYEGGAFGIRDAGYLPATNARGFAPGVAGVYSGYYLGAPRTFGLELQYRFF